jgi:hypothetical protein
MGMFRTLLMSEQAKGNDENTLLLLHGDDFTDSSQYKRTVNAYTTSGATAISIDKTGGRFGGCFYNSNVNKRVYRHGTVSKTITNTYTVDCWIKLLDYASPYGVVFTIGSGLKGIFFQTLPGSDALDLYIKSKQYTGESVNGVKLSRDIPLGEWVHIAFVGTPDYTRLYINGKKMFDAPAYDLSTTNFRLYDSDTYSGRCVKGYIDEFRISDIARWARNFNPPSRPYGP